MAEAVVGTLKAILIADDSKFTASMRKAAEAPKAVEKSVEGLGKEVAKLTPQAERMVKAFGGDKLLYQANNLTAAVQKLGGAQRLTESEQAKVNSTVTAAIDKYRALGLQAPKAMTDLAAATQKGEGALSAFSSRLGLTQIAFGSFIGNLAGNLVQRGISSLVNLGAEAFKSAGHILDLRNKTGLTAETIQRMQFVADQTGASLEQFTEASFKLGERLAGGSASVVGAVKALGLSYEQLKAQTPSAQFEAIVGALGDMQSATERNRLGVEIFGKSFTNIAAAVGEGYRQIAKDAKTSSDAQLEALDRAADRATAFWTNTKTRLAALIGQELLVQDVGRQVTAEFEKQGKGLDRVGIAMEVQRRIQLGLIGAKRDDITLTREQVQASTDYVAALAAARAELSKLDAGERAQIAAAQKMGTDTDELVKLLVQFGVSADHAKTVLSLLNDQTKDYAKSANQAAEAQRKWIEAIEKGSAGLRFWMSQIGVMPAAIHDASDELIEMRGRIVGAASGFDELAASAERFKAAKKKLDESGATAVPFKIESEGVSLEPVERELSDLQKRIASDFDGMTQGVADAFGDMLVYTRSFTEGALDILHSFQRGVANIFGDIAKDYINGFLRNIIGAVTGRGAGGVAGNAASAAGFASLLGGGSAVSSSFLASAPGLGAAGGGIVAGEGIGGVGAASAGGGGGAAGGFLTNPAFWTNPYTIAGVAGAALLTWAITKKGLFRGGEEGTQVNPARDQFFEQFVRKFGGTPYKALTKAFGMAHVPGNVADSEIRALYAADSMKRFRAAESDIVNTLAAGNVRGIKMFNFGGFVPPGVVQPAILHGGTFGEDIVPRQSPASPAGTTVHVHNHINAIDGPSVERFVRSDAYLNAMKFVFTHNKGFLVTHLQQVQT